MFPEEYTDFTQKVDATYEGDPIGDYVMAEHVNKLQEAISKLEESIGVHHSSSLTLSERIAYLEKVQKMRVPSSLVLSESGYLTNIQSSVEKLSVFNLTSLKTIIPETKQIIELLVAKDKVIAGQINANKNLNEIQAEIGAWKNVSATAIHLKNFGGETSTRNLENEIIYSVLEKDMDVIIESDNWPKLITDTVESIYNPEGKELFLNNRIIISIKEFAYGGRQYFGSEVANKMDLFLKLRKKHNLKLMGIANPTNQEQYNYVEAYGLAYSLDYLYNGPIEGFVNNAALPVYDWPSYIGQWKEEEPIIFIENDYVYRYINDGKIIINKNLSISIDGYTLNSTLIEWVSNSVSGDIIKDYSMDPTKLSTYDVDRILELINANGTVKIKPEMIDSESGGTLPTNIPAPNMRVNVILAANQKNDVDTTESQQIIDASLKNLNANKLFGNIEKDRMTLNVIGSINASNSEINVKSAKIESLTSLTVQSEVVNSTQGTFESLNITTSLSTVDMTVTGFLTGNDGSFNKLKVTQLNAETLEAKRLKVEDLEADNMVTLILDAIEANIETGIFDKIVTQALTAETIKVELIDAINSIIGTATIDGAIIKEASIIDAQIVSLNALKLTAGTIDTAKVNISGPNGNLLIRENTIKIYDKPDSSNLQRLRILIGQVTEITEKPEDYGMVILGEDGTTRLYDHTGVYNAGLHDNVISNDKVQDDAIEGRNIIADSILAKHIVAEAITTEKLAAASVNANKIAANTIVAGSAIIADAAIGNAMISELNGNKIIANTITSKEIKANSITADRLVIGYQNNLIKDGYDSFEQYLVNSKPATVLSGADAYKVSEDYSYDGDKSLLIRGNSASNKILLASKVTSLSTTVTPSKTYIVSAYAYTDSVSSVGVVIGLKFPTTEIISPINFISNADGTKRIWFEITIPTGTNKTALILETKSTNTNVWFDAIQIEEKETGMVGPGWFRPTSLTSISGEMIKTGTIDAQRIKIGTGTVFGDNDVIEITDAGIKAKSITGWAMLNSKGLEINGGSFILENIGKIRIDGTTGITIESNANKISLNPNLGIQIKKKFNDEIVFNTDISTGEVYIKGKLEVTSSDSIYNKTEINNKVEGLTSDIENLNNGISAKTFINVGLKTGYSDFTTVDAKAVFLCGFKRDNLTNEDELSDIDGSIRNWENNSTITVPKQKVDITSAPPTSDGYLIYDNTTQNVWYVYYNDLEVWMKHSYGKAEDNTEMIFNESTYVLGELDLN